MADILWSLNEIGPNFNMKRQHFRGSILEVMIYGTRLSRDWRCYLISGVTNLYRTTGLDVLIIKIDSNNTNASFQDSNTAQKTSPSSGFYIAVLSLMMSFYFRRKLRRR